MYNIQTWGKAEPDYIKNLGKGTSSKSKKICKFSLTYYNPMLAILKCWNQTKTVQFQFQIHLQQIPTSNQRKQPAYASFYDFYLSKIN